MKKILVILQCSAFASAKGRESHDLLLALAAVEHQITVLYRGAGVTQLISTAQHNAPLKDYTKSQKLFSLYDIDTVYACAKSLAFYQTTVEKLNIPVELLNGHQQQQLIGQFDEVIFS